MPKKPITVRILSSDLPKLSLNVKEAVNNGLFHMYEEEEGEKHKYFIDTGQKLYYCLDGEGDVLYLKPNCIYEGHHRLKMVYFDDLPFPPSISEIIKQDIEDKKLTLKEIDRVMTRIMNGTIFDTNREGRYPEEYDVTPEDFTSIEDLVVVDHHTRME